MSEANSIPRPDLPQDLPAHLQPPAADSAAARILTAARTLFAERGMAATSTRAIAKHAGVNLALIHYYFGNKEQLYRRVVAQEVLDLRRIIGEVFAPGTPPAEILPNMPRIALRLHLEHPQLIRVLLREVADGAPNLPVILAELGEYGPQGARDLLLEQIRLGQAAGMAPGIEPRHLVAILFTVGNGLQAFSPLLKELLGIDMKDEATYAAVLGTVEQLFRRALAPDKEA